MEREEQWLQRRGWHVKPQALLSLLNHMTEDGLSVPPAPDDIIAQLLDSDLKDVGSPSLPDTSSLHRVSRLQGPLVLQVVSVRNISQSSSKSLLRSGNDQHGRLLRIRLTDGCTIVSAIEYHSMPAFSQDVAPGTKVKLENVVSVQSGFLLGDSQSFTILGGQVPALYEGWQMERKYSGLSRMTGTKTARAEGDSGPPPFRGLHVPRADVDKKRPGKQQLQQQGVHLEDVERNGLQQKEGKRSSLVSGKDSKGLGDQGIAEMPNSFKPGSLTSSRTPTSEASSSHQAENKRQPQDEDDASLEKSKDIDLRKDAIKAVLALGVETVPLQNRAAAQKLLDKRTELYSRQEHGRGRGGRGRGRRGERQQEEATLTLDEWEAKRGVSNSSINQMAMEANTRDDEALAQRLHYQLNMESSAHGTAGKAYGEAEQIRLSMFSFAGDKDGNDDSGRGRHGGRGRGRGRGGRRRGR